MSARYSRPASREYSYTRRVQRPPSPPMDDPSSARFSLPSISTLIEAADEGTGRERLQIDPRLQKVVVDPQLLAQSQERSPISPATNPSHSPASATSGSERRAPASAIKDVEAHSRRQMDYPPVPQDRPGRVLQGPLSPYTASSYGSPGNGSVSSYQSSPIDGSNNHGSAYQRALPSNFPPMSSYDEPAGQYISHATPAWQHHHHFPHSASTPYPPNQDRYICGTCNKAFSRPSSLKIHTYSHTGEKPWKCQVPGCGKTFSVRSNMKRHEKGCHGDGGYPNGNLGRESPESAS
ncbi:hypothetical protein GJ744_003222 [Endocarpon pusillum]|uniref:C2H2-type domain-containing protein n=1 Tax=Endocarpon pusillum TaxID=364733 RepID=A0A8H7DZJ2_9EURO|nr:hypothetical protein GJ744_003222 [Endocarpon pusillum]